MAETLPLLTERADHALFITFNRPDKLNAISTAMLEALASALSEARDDEAVRAVVLTGSGPKAFVAGADIGEYAGQSEREFVAYQHRSREIFCAIERLPKPVVAAVNGYALGGGFEIALACDIIVASENARFGLPEGLLGLCPGGGGTQRLTRAVGRYTASEILLAARRITATRAHALGLVAEVVAPDALRETALTWAGYCAGVAPLASGAMKRLIREGADAALDSGLTLEQETLARLHTTHDGREGIRAFTEKRSPEFKGQ